MKSILKRFKLKKAFTVIELIVVMATVSILVFLGSLAYNGYTKQANKTQLLYDTRLINDACERYYVSNGDYPRLSDVPYTAAQVSAFSDKVYNCKGEVVTLDASGNYYDIDLSKLRKYVTIKESYTNFVLQNPVGDIYAVDPIKNIRLPQNSNMAPKPTAVITMTPESSVNTATRITWSYSDSTDSNNFSIINAEWQGKQDMYSSAATYTVKLRVENQLGTWSDWVSKTVVVTPAFTSQSFNYTGNMQAWTAPCDGTYELDVWGASAGGKGGYAAGTISLTANQVLYIYIGGTNGYNKASSGGGDSYFSETGAGGTDIRKNGQTLSDRVIAAGGGGGGTNSSSSGYNGGTLIYQFNGQGGDGGGLVGNIGVYSPNTGAASGGKVGLNGVTSNKTISEALYLYYGGGGGGSAYLGGVQNGTTTTGINTGNGKAVIKLIK